MGQLKRKNYWSDEATIKKAQKLFGATLVTRNPEDFQMISTMKPTRFEVWE